GGAEDKLGHRTVLHHFVQLAGGRRARIAVIATAASLGGGILGLYWGVFTHLGRAGVIPLRPAAREEADAPGPAEAVGRATGVFMTGGNQLRLSMVVSGTRLGAALLDAPRRGAVGGGTSAGGAPPRPGERPERPHGRLRRSRRDRQAAAGPHVGRPRAAPRGGHRPALQPAQPAGGAASACGRGPHPAR